jgi:hypothetical protein
MRKLLPYLRLRTLTQEQMAELPETCINPLEKLALLKDVCTKSLKRKAETSLSDPFNNSLKKRVRTYSDSRCTIIPTELMAQKVEDIAIENKHKTSCKSLVNYLDIVLKKEIFLTKLEVLGRIDDVPSIEFNPGNQLYENIPQEKNYALQVCF